MRGQVGGGVAFEGKIAMLYVCRQIVFLGCCWGAVGVLLGFVLGGCSVVVWCCGGGDLELLVSGAFGLWS